MTIVTRMPRQLPVSHAYVVPVVRELTLPRSAPAGDPW